MITIPVGILQDVTIIGAIYLAVRYPFGPTKLKSCGVLHLRGPSLPPTNSKMIYLIVVAQIVSSTVRVGQSDPN